MLAPFLHLRRPRGSTMMFPTSNHELFLFYTFCLCLTVSIVSFSSHHMPSKPPKVGPVSVDVGDKKSLLTSYNPLNGVHTLVCDLCGFSMDIGRSASAGNFIKHRNSGPCKAGQEEVYQASKPTPTLSIDTSDLEPTSGPSTATTLYFTPSSTHSTSLLSRFEPGTSTLSRSSSLSNISALLGMHSRLSSLGGLTSALTICSPNEQPILSCPNFRIHIKCVWFDYAYSAHAGTKYAWQPVAIHPHFESGLQCSALQESMAESIGSDGRWRWSVCS
jgi:hypothetical protein